MKKLIKKYRVCEKIHKIHIFSKKVFLERGRNVILIGESESGYTVQDWKEL